MINGKQWPTYQQFDGWESVPISCYQPANCILLNASDNLPARSSSMLSPPQITGYLHHGTWKWWFGQKSILANHVNFGSTILNCFCPGIPLKHPIRGGVLRWWESKGNPSNASPPQKKNALLRGYQPWLALNNLLIWPSLVGGETTHLQIGSFPQGMGGNKNPKTLLKWKQPSNLCCPGSQPPF